MAIYNIFDYSEETSPENMAGKPYAMQMEFPSFEEERQQEEKGRFFSALAARFFFFLLLIADIFWCIYSISAVVVKSVLCVLSMFKILPLIESLSLSWLSFKRSLVCAIALFVAIFAPALGIMFSCMYFLMYDKTGVDEVVPTSLRDQFKDFLPMDWSESSL